MKFFQNLYGKANFQKLSLKMVYENEIWENWLYPLYNIYMHGKYIFTCRFY